MERQEIAQTCPTVSKRVLLPQKPQEIRARQEVKFHQAQQLLLMEVHNHRLDMPLVVKLLHLK
jgi:hypothetical protein